MANNTVGWQDGFCNWVVLYPDGRFFGRYFDPCVAENWARFLGTEPIRIGLDEIWDAQNKCAVPAAIED